MEDRCQKEPKSNQRNGSTCRRQHCQRESAETHGEMKSKNADDEGQS